MAHLSVIAVYLFVMSLVFRFEPWHIKWLGLYIVAICLGSFHIGKRFHWTLGLLAAYILISASYLSTMTFLPVGIKTKFYVIYCAWSLILTCIIPILTAKYKKSIESAIGWSCLYNAVASVILCLCAKESMHNFGGFFGNNSINACYLAITLPYFLDRTELTKKTAWVLAALVILPPFFLRPTSVGIGALAVSLAVYIFSKTRKIYLLAIPIVLCTIGGYYIDKQFFYSNKRFETYSIFYKSWNESNRKTLGTGTGTFPIISSKYQDRTQYNLQPIHDSKGKRVGSHGYFHYLHSDWLEHLITGGYTGLLLALLAFVFAATYAFRQGLHHAFSALITYGAVAVFNYPTKLAIHSFVLVFTLFIIYERGNDNASLLRGRLHKRNKHSKEKA